MALENEIWPEVEQEEYQHLLDPNDPSSFYADGDLQFPETPTFHDWKVHGLVNINTAFQVSADNYFWGIALKIYYDEDENLLQEWARVLGYGPASTASTALAWAVLALRAGALAPPGGGIARALVVCDDPEVGACAIVLASEG